MLDTAQKLAHLKQRVAAIDRKFRTSKPAEPPPSQVRVPNRARCFIEQWSEGEVVKNDFGEHFQTERVFAAHKQHGSADIGALGHLPQDLLSAVGENQIPAVSPDRWAFLDTETTGLAIDGCYAFLIGVGRIAPEGFKIRQFFLREYGEERSALAALEMHLKKFNVLITYNGKTYDEPLLETRYRMRGLKPPFGRLAHLDLLHGARRLWKLRLDNCRLMKIEQEVLGVCREGDLAGEMIPYVYFEYLRSHEAERLVPIFHHNAIDILTLACLTAIVPAAFRETDAESLSRLGVRRGEDLAGIARWLRAAEEHEQALALFRRAVDAGLPDGLLFRTLWEIARLEKKLERQHAALPVFTELATCRNEYRLSALEELAKYYEHEQKNYAVALEFTNQALGCGISAALDHRKARLERRLAKRLSAAGLKRFPGPDDPTSRSHD